MGALEKLTIQWTPRLDLHELVRQLNKILRQVSLELTDTFRRSYPEVSWTTATNGTVPLWIPDENVRIEAVSIVSTTAAGSVSPQIGGAAVGGAPFNFTASTVKHEPTSANDATAQQLVSLVFAGLTGTATVTMKIRRLG